MNTDDGNQRDSLGRFLRGSRGGVKGNKPEPVRADFKRMLQETLAKLGYRHLYEWAQENPTEFYRLAGRLIPQQKEVSGPDGKNNRR